MFNQRVEFSKNSSTNIFNYSVEYYEDLYFKNIHYSQLLIFLEMIEIQHFFAIIFRKMDLVPLKEVHFIKISNFNLFRKF